MNKQEILNIITKLKSLKQNIENYKDNINDNINTTTVLNINNYIDSKLLLIDNIVTDLENLSNESN